MQRQEATQTRVLAYAPLRVGVKSIGVLALLSSALERSSIEAIAGLVALALERTRFLKEVSRTEVLRQSDELKSALLASVSHDLRTPLTSIRAAVDSLLQSGMEWDKEMVREFHLIISEEVQRLTKLVQNLLEMARIEAGELHLEKRWTAVSEIIATVVERCREVARNHTIRVEVEEGLPLANVDSLLVSEALSHLVENAAKYSPAGGDITIRGQIENQNLLLSVEDRGPGIAVDEIERIFDKFYRAAASRQSRRSGTGMGLSIARGIIEAHGGRIWAESKEGLGSLFFLAIPVEVRSSDDARLRVEQDREKVVEKSV